MTRKVTGNTLFAKRLKAIRPYVSFDFNLKEKPTASQKRKVKKYYDEISKLQNRPYQIFRPNRRADRLRKAQKFAQQESGFPGIKVAFIPSDGGAPGKIVWKRGLPVFIKKHLEISDLQFDPKKLVAKKGPKAYVDSLVDLENDKVRYTVNAGEFEIPRPLLPENLGPYVAELCTRYGGLGPPPDEYEKGSRHWVWWLTGAKVYTTRDQEDDINQYFIEKQKAIRAAKNERRRIKRQRRYRKDKQT